MSLKLDLWRLIMDKIKIEDVCDILNGFAFKSDNYVDKGIRIIRIANVQKGYIEDSAPVFYPLNSTGLDKYMLEKGDLLISLTGNVGRVAILQEEMLPAALNQRVACLRIKSEKISKGYLFHILNSDFFERKCIQSAKGVAQKNMSTEWLKNYKIPLYSTEQQSEIVSVLDTLQSIICNRKYELQMLDNLIKARFVELFGEPGTNPMNWKETTIGEECFYIKDGPHKSLSDIGKGNGGHPFISVRNIVDGYINFSNAKYISDEDYAAAIKKCHPEKGDMLYSKGGTTGIAKLIDVEEKFANWVHVAVLKFDKEKLNGVFFENMLNSTYCYEQSQRLTKGIANRDLVLSAMAQIKMYRPPLELQNQFADFVAQIDKSKATVQKALDETQLLFDSLMQQYFG